MVCRSCRICLLEGSSEDDPLIRLASRDFEMFESTQHPSKKTDQGHASARDLLNMCTLAVCATGSAASEICRV